MKRSTIAAIATAAVLVVGGGTAYALTTNGQEPAPVETVTSSPTPSETPTDAPSEPEKPLEVETTAAPSADALFLADARDRLTGLGAATTIPNVTDEQLIAAGHQICDQLKDGTPLDDVTVIEGEQRVQGSYLDSAALSRSGLLFYCPELNGKVD